MGAISTPRPVQLFCGVIFSAGISIQEVKNDLTAAFGPVDSVSDTFEFSFTDYYEQEMGAGLRKIFYSIDKLVPPDFIVDAKLRTNALEEKYLESAGPSASRRVNLDPGYVALSKMVLASTKDFFHRIYLKDGIYAETTLNYRKPSFEPFPWTYPDYRSPGYVKFFNDLRELYKNKLKQKD